MLTISPKRRVWPNARALMSALDQKQTITTDCAMIAPLKRGNAMGGKKILVLLFCLLAGPAWAQTSIAAKVRHYADTNRAAIVTEYLKLLALPNIHGDAPALQRNAALLRSMMQERGL